MKRYYFLSFFLLFFSPSISGAQGLDIGNSLNLLLTPERPGAHQLVEARLESFTANLDRAEITWLLDGEVEEQGMGETRFSFTTKELGSETVLSVSIKTFDGNFLNQTLKLHPAEVTLLWQAYSYTPPFYRGKALLPIQGIASVMAFPTLVTTAGETILPEEIIYTWRENGHVSADGSGTGKFSFAVKSGIPIRPVTVSVEASAPDHGLIAFRETTIEPVPPELLFYEDHPLFGRNISRALARDFELRADEMRIAAIPYFFETKERTGSGLSYEWSVNGAISKETGPDLTLRRSGNEAGRAQLFLSVTSPTSIFQTAEALATVMIGAAPFGTN